MASKWMKEGIFFRWKQDYIPSVEDYKQLPPHDDTNCIAAYFQQIADQLHKDPYSGRVLHANHFCRSLKVMYRWNGDSKMPWINTSGRWLEKLGFKIGRYARVFPFEKVIIICLDEDHFESDTK